MRLWPTFWGLLGALGFLVVAQLDGPELWQGFLLAIPLMIVTIGWGWRAGTALIPVGLSLLLLMHGRSATTLPWWYYPGTAGLLFIWVWSGNSIYRLWRSTEQRARRHAKQAQLLADAVMTLNKCRSDQEVYEALPALLADILSFSHAEVLCPTEDGKHLLIAASHRWDIPEGFKVPLGSISGRAYRSGNWQYVPDTSRDPDYLRAPNVVTSRSELALPLTRLGRIVAILNVESALPANFTQGDQRTLRAFAKIAEEALLRVNTLATLEGQIDERSSVASLNHQLLRAQSAEEAAQFALQELGDLLELKYLAVFTLMEGRFRPLTTLVPEELLARNTVLADLLRRGPPWQRGQLYVSWSERRAIFIDDYQTSPLADPAFQALGLKSTAFVPITNAGGEVQALLEAASFEAPHRWTDRERRVLSNVADTLGLALERAVTDKRLREMLEVIRQLAQADDPSRLYQSTVEAAVRLIPDAEAASLLVKQDELFVFKGSYNYQDEGLKELPGIPETLQHGWYGGDHESYLNGLPRVLRGAEVAKRSHAARPTETSHAQLDESGRVDEIRSNLCVPVVYGHEVIGMLNLDSLTRDDAFGSTALALAEAFAQQIAVIIRQAEYRQALEQNALTDPLTGLGNRAGFNRRLEEELAEAQRYGHPLSLIMMDLDGFKTINDSFGHPTGDQALISVAQALRQARRQADSLYRWGGDEFALILPETTAAGASSAAGRYLAAVRQVSIEGRELEASAGVASFPADGESSEMLLKKADDLMYADKAVV